MRYMLTVVLVWLALIAAFIGFTLLHPPIPKDLGNVADLDLECSRFTVPVAGDTVQVWMRVHRVHDVPAVVLMLHGYAREHHRMWRYLAEPALTPAVVIAPDFRSSRRTGRLPTTLGAYELDDARAVLAWIEQQPQLKRLPICVFGEGLGGSVALLLAAEHPEIAAVAVDSPYATGRMAIEDALATQTHLESPRTVTACGRIVRAITGRDPFALDAVDAVRRYGDRPLLLVQSGIEDQIRRRQTLALENAAGGGAEGWLVLDAGMNQAWNRHRGEYAQRLWTFMRRAALKHLKSHPE